MIVANPPGNAEQVRLPLDEPAEAHALHASTHQETPRLDRFFGGSHTSPVKCTVILREGSTSRTPFFAQDATSTLCSGQVHALSRVNLDLLAFVNERRDLHHQSGLRFRGLGYAGSSGAFQSRLSFYHRENHGLRKLDAHRLAIKKFHLDLKIGDEIVHGVAQNFLGQMSLLIVRSVHEVVRVSVGIEELHFHFIHIHFFNRIGRAKAVLEHGARAQIAQLGLDESAKIARRAVLHTEHGMKVIVVLDDHAGAELRGRDRHREKSPSEIAFTERAEGGSANNFRRHKDKKLFYTQLCRKGNLPPAAFILPVPIELSSRSAPAQLKCLQTLIHTTMPGSHPGGNEVFIDALRTLRIFRRSSCRHGRYLPADRIGGWRPGRASPRPEEWQQLRRDLRRGYN